MRALVTGANGFIGSALCQRLIRQGVFVRAAVRRSNAAPHSSEAALIGDIDGATDWSPLLEGVDTVFHLAGRAHVFGKGSRATEDFRKVNVDGTEAVARAAASRGVRSFVFLSTAKVNGDSDGGRAFREEDPPRPTDAYSRSKWEAEQRLAEVAKATGMSTTIVRPPLVYGPGVKANFLKLIEIVDRRLPLPLGAVKNSRSLVYVENLCDALIATAQRRTSSIDTFFVSDGEDVSTPALIRKIAASLQAPARLINVPPVLLKVAATVTGKREQLDRLLDSLRVDTSRIEQRLNWKRPFSMSDGLRATAEWYRQSK